MYDMWYDKRIQNINVKNMNIENAINQSKSNICTILFMYELIYRIGSSYQYNKWIFYFY